MDFSICKMTLTDLEELKSILTTEFDDFWNYNILKEEFLSEFSKFVVAKNSQNEIVGFASVQFILDEASITNIVTKKAYRNHGIGGLLLSELIKISAEKNMSKMTLEVNENNKYAIKLYEKFDFKTTGYRKNYYNGTETAIIMDLEMKK